jgi:hypothetical protein
VRRTLIVVTAIAFVFFACAPALARKIVASPVYEVEPSRYPNVEFWFDDVESGAAGYVTTDFSSDATPHFHVDTYMAFDGSYSWWCGTFMYDTDGGYGNSWDDRLDIPPVDWTGYTYPILTYAFRHDSETGYDFTYVQAESNGVFVDLNRGYDGSAVWTDIGIYGFVMVAYDNPIVARFRFISDGAWSDEDGLYLSVGGAFMCDNVKIFDYFAGYDFFFDTVESGDPDDCVPSVPAASGDYWHIIDRACPALSDPHCWWCGDDADTSLVPPLLQNGLYSPLVDLDGALSCTVRFAQHFAIPTVDNDYISYKGTCNGVDYYDIASYWGDFGSCDGWGGTAYNIGFDIGQFCEAGRPLTWGGFLWTMYTTDNGCGPAGGGDAGAMIDDILFLGEHEDPAEHTTWGALKALYR